jgi:pseudaminic acid cytidylyltransferase
MKLAVIPARGGSKRIPKKNIKVFCGKPIISYAIEAAIASRVFDHIVVSTDDPQVAEVARKDGAEVPFLRPAKLSDDHMPTVPVIKHTIDWMTANRAAVSAVCCIYATAPFVAADDIRQAYSKLVNEAVTGYVFSATSFSFPIQRAFRIKKDGYCEMFHPENYNTRSQDLEHAYQDAGQFYWGSAESYLSNKEFFSNDSKPYLIPRYRVQDIDTMADWMRAEIMWRILQEEQLLDAEQEQINGR